MKKFLFLIVFVCLIFVTGCEAPDFITVTHTKTCTLTETDTDGYKTDNSVVIQYGSDNVIDTLKYNTVIEMEDEYIETSYLTLDEMISVYDDVDGLEGSVTKGEGTITFNMFYDFAEFDFEEYLEASEYEYSIDEDSIFATAEDSQINVDDFVESELDGYTCN